MGARANCLNPPVIDARVRRKSEKVWDCFAAVGVEFLDSMLSWSPGLRETMNLGEALVRRGPDLDFFSRALSREPEQSAAFA